MSSNNNNISNGPPVVQASTFTPAKRNNKRNNAGVNLDIIQKQMNAMMEDNKKIHQELREMKEATSSGKKKIRKIRNPEQSVCNILNLMFQLTCVLIVPCLYFLQHCIRNSYKEYIEMNQDGWSFDAAPQAKENEHVRSYLFEACRNHDAELNGIYDEDGKSRHTMTEERKTTTNSRITSAFYSQKRQHVRFLTLSSEEIAHQRAVTNRDARLREVSIEYKTQINNYLTFIILITETLQKNDHVQFEQGRHQRKIWC